MGIDPSRSKRPGGATEGVPLWGSTTLGCRDPTARAMGYYLPPLRGYSPSRLRLLSLRTHFGEQLLELLPPADRLQVRIGPQSVGVLEAAGDRLPQQIDRPVAAARQGVDARGLIECL